ncbi:MAG TPA: hypothetical protein VGH70_04610 [Bradyrhizobium sp.]|jgi:hypothetical protein
MPLPTQAQVNTAGRYVGTILGTAIAIFGLEAKGISADQVKAVIAAAGTAVNDIVVMLAALAPIYAAVRGILSSSDTGRAAAIGAHAKTIVQPAANGTATVTITDPAMASAALDAQKNAA